MTQHDTVFVYGTLRPPRTADHSAYCQFFPRISLFVTEAWSAHLEGAELYDFGNYPAAFPGFGTVHGTILRVQRPGLTIMDTIEGHPSFFVRHWGRVGTTQGYYKAWIYWGPHILRGQGVLIHSGDWLTGARCAASSSAVGR